LTFDEFVALRLTALLRYAVVLTGNRELAQDVVQEALITAYRRWNTVARSDRPEAYVRRIVTRQFLSWQRRLSRRAALIRGRRGWFTETTAADHAPGVADRDEVARRLATLPPRQRAAIVLRYFEGFTDVESAEVLGCSPASVRSYLSRGLASLRTALDAAELKEEVR
jgi:RNA polymerase sigma-70 factor (sigma-E family)